jgi:hypothetical protein
LAGLVASAEQQHDFAAAGSRNRAPANYRDLIEIEAVGWVELFAKPITPRRDLNAIRRDVASPGDALRTVVLIRGLGGRPDSPAKFSQ